MKEGKDYTETPDSMLKTLSSDTNKDEEESPLEAGKTSAEACKTLLETDKQLCDGSKDDEEHAIEPENESYEPTDSIIESRNPLSDCAGNNENSDKDAANDSTETTENDIETKNLLNSETFVNENTGVMEAAKNNIEIAENVHENNQSSDANKESSKIIETGNDSKLSRNDNIDLESGKGCALKDTITGISELEINNSLASDVKDTKNDLTFESESKEDPPKETAAADNDTGPTT